MKKAPVLSGAFSFICTILDSLAGLRVPGIRRGRTAPCLFCHKEQRCTLSAKKQYGFPVTAQLKASHRFASAKRPALELVRCADEVLSLYFPYEH